MKLLVIVAGLLIPGAIDPVVVNIPTTGDCEQIADDLMRAIPARDGAYMGFACITIDTDKEDPNGS